MRVVPDNTLKSVKEIEEFRISLAQVLAFPPGEVVLRLGREELAHIIIEILELFTLGLDEGEELEVLLDEEFLKLSPLKDLEQLTSEIMDYGVKLSFKVIKLPPVGSAKFFNTLREVKSLRFELGVREALISPFLSDSRGWLIAKAYRGAFDLILTYLERDFGEITLDQSFRGKLISKLKRTKPDLFAVPWEDRWISWSRFPIDDHLSEYLSLQARRKGEGYDQVGVPET